MMNTNIKTLEKPADFNLFSGILLLTGTCIGAGMLALPVVTGVAGFYPSLAISTCCWLIMLCTGLLFLEATLWMDGETNLLSMATRFLGPVGKVVGGLSFLFLYYCLEVSYISGGAPLFGILFEKIGIVLPGNFSYFLFAAVFGLIVYAGSRVIGRVNWMLMSGLILSYLLLTIVGSSQVQSELLSHRDWKICAFAAPTLFSAYGYHNIIPTLTGYMKKNAWHLRLTIFIGTLIPFLVYSIWQWMIIGTIPQEELKLAVKTGMPINQALQAITGNVWVSTLGAFFGFFALVTSFLGVSLSMVDFLSDGLKTSNRGFSRLILCLVVLGPSAIFAAQNPDIFITAIGYAGGFGEGVLNGLFPILMVWIGRYWMNLESPYRLFGGRFTLSLLMLLILSIIGIELFLAITSQ